MTKDVQINSTRPSPISYIFFIPSQKTQETDNHFSDAIPPVNDIILDAYKYYG